MPDYPASFDHMLAAWNEPDSKKVRSHLDEALAADIHFVDPTIDLTGIDDFEAMVHKVQKGIPGATYARSSGVDSHHNLYRYHWEIHLDGELQVDGFDVASTDENGMVNMVLGFFGPVPSSSD